ncbi:MAG: hypothetical protein KIS76_05365 [Pyrinomonadaceae bacterium]|nr:hypothetical protein [Pyrinomonadaceae bacterium]
MMSLKKTNLHILSQFKDLSANAKTGVSLHCHTEHSKEMLDFVPHYADKLPVISYFWKKERKKYIEREGRDIDFTTGFWSPPLTAQQVFELERDQINRSGLDALVSLTDHDSIDANLKVQENGKAAPISLEWTVPFEFGFFHVGVHNLPKDRAVELTKTLLDFTFDEQKHNNETLREMFTMLNELPEVLVVLNHPLWDIELVGKERHKVLLKNFLKEHGKWIHAFEINGFRSWSENKAVIEMAEALNYPLVTGGDRHGCKPNTVINLTNSKTFAEFAEEIRVDKHSEVVLMPEYRQPLHSRQLQSFSEILSHYPEFPDGRQKWFDRIHFDVGDGHGVRPLSVHWYYGGPTWLRWAVWTLGVFGSPKMRPFFSIARKKKDRVPKNISKTKFEIPELHEITASLANDQPQTKTEFAA